MLTFGKNDTQNQPLNLQFIVIKNREHNKIYNLI